MNRRSSLDYSTTPAYRPGSSRLSLGGRRSIGGVRHQATPLAAAHSTGSESSPSAFLVIQNDDEEERRQRQLSRLQQLQNSRQLGSPSVDESRRKSISSLEPRLTGQQLTQHYAKCIQLSAENKINVKNAFNLQLIDYMTEMLRRKDSDMNNFQVASCTLDASTKIYAYRVDCVHTDTVRMAGGLGRAHDKEHKPEDPGSQEEETTSKLKRRRTRKAATIESNSANLTLSSLDLDFNIDPLFKKISSQFDEGRAGGGLFLNSLMLKDDGCQLLLDSETVLDTVSAESDRPSSLVCNVLVPRLPEKIYEKEVCPAFTNFHFTDWKLSDENTSTCEASLKETKCKTDDSEGCDHTFDINAVPEPLEEDPLFVEDGADCAGLEDCEAEDDTVAATIGVGGNNTCLTVGWGGQHANSAVVQPESMETIHLKEHLASVPLEYSYFDSRLMSAWAGPSHWKLKPASKPLTAQRTTDPSSNKRRKKADFALDFRESLESLAAIDKQFEVTRRLTKLSQNTIKLWSDEKTTLPEDLHFDPNDFSKLFGRTEVVVRRLLNNTTAVTTIQDEEDTEEHTIVPSDDLHAPYDDNEPVGTGDTSGQGYDMTLFSQTLAPGSQGGTGSVPLPGMDFCGDNLVQAPNRVAKINIGYARTAKRMDMKRLKNTVWDLLTSASPDKENDKNANVSSESSSDGLKGCPRLAQHVKFSEVYRALPSRLTASMAENLSLPLAFIALLHLCNERNLHLTDVGNMTDFIIRQD